ncbi:GntR family transcriptional regulator, partial [Thermodesulfobacteriota bacterium]
MKKITKKIIAYDHLKKQLIGIVIKPGEPINEHSIAEKLNISVTPVREAMQQLQSEGFIENIKNKGSFATNISLLDLKNIYDVRLIIEKSLVEHVFEKIDKDKLNQLKKKYAEKNVKNYSRLSFSGDEIHYLIVNTFGNLELTKIYQSLVEKSKRIRNIYFSNLGKKGFKMSLKEHREIINSLIQKDPDRARKAMIT